jgi:hypothetical protein
MNDLLLKRLKELKAAQTSTLDMDELDSAEPEGLGALGMSKFGEKQTPDGAMDESDTEVPGYQAGEKIPTRKFQPTEEETEETIQDPEAPESVRREAIQRVRQKYLQTK